MDSHNLEPHELNDRIKMYSHKLSQQWSTIPEDSSNSSKGLFKFLTVYTHVWSVWRPELNVSITGLLKDVPSAVAEVLLSSTPIIDADLLMVCIYLFKCDKNKL